MAEKPVSISPNREFKGMASNIDPGDLPEGYFQEIVNMSPHRGGSIAARDGTSPMSFKTEKMDGPDSEQLWSIYAYRYGTFTFVITESDIGKVYGNEGPWIDRTGDVPTQSDDWREIWDGDTGGLFPDELYKAWFATVPGQVLMAFTGLDRPLRWDGATDLAELAGIDAPEAETPGSDAITITTNETPEGNGPGPFEGTYTVAIRWADVNNQQVGNLSELQPITVPVHSLHDPEADPPDPHYVSLNWDWDEAVPDTGLQPRIDFVQLWRSTVGQSTTLYLVEEFGAQGPADTMTSAGASPVRLFSPLHRLIYTVSEKEVTVKIQGTGTSLDGNEYVAEVVDEDHFDLRGTASTGITLGPDGFWNSVSFQYDKYSDDELANTTDADSILPILNPDGTLNAYRYGVPPDWMRLAVPFKNRLWMAGNSEYSRGTATSTTGSDELDGTGVRWTDIMIGRQVTWVGAEDWYTITDVQGVNKLILDRKVTSASVSDVEYVITKGPYENGKLYFSEADLFEAVPAINTVNLMKESLDDDEHITALIPKGNYMYVTKLRHLHRLAYVQQPAIDTSITLSLTRGCVNAWSWAYVEDWIYMMDELGAYRYNGNQIVPLSEPIQDFFWTRIAWEAKDKFHVVWDQFAEQVLYFVSLYEEMPDGTDPATFYPTTALVYDYRTEGWLLYRYAMQMRCSSVCPVEGRQHDAIGITLPTSPVKPRVWVLTDGLEDGVAKEGTRTGQPNSFGAANELTDLSADFPLDIEGSKLCIYEGQSKHAQNVVQTRNSGTQLTFVDDWDPPLDGSSKYAVGAIEYSIKTPRKEFDLQIEPQARREARLHFDPPEIAWITNVQYWLNHSDTAEVSESDTDFGDNVIGQIGLPDYEIQMGPLEDGSKQTGFARLPFYGRVEDYADADRWVTVEFFGVQSPHLVQFFYIDMMGVR